MIALPGMAETRAAAGRIRGYVRRTPLLAATPIRERRELLGGLRLKLETVQVTDSFKARGAINAVFALPPAQLRRGKRRCARRPVGFGTRSGSPPSSAAPLRSQHCFLAAMQSRQASRYAPLSAVPEPTGSTSLDFFQTADFRVPAAKLRPSPSREATKDQD